MNRGPVSLGLNKLKEAVKGKKIALMMNNTALTEAGKSLIDTMHFEWNADIRFAGNGARRKGRAKGRSKGGKCRRSDDRLPVVSLYDFPIKPPSSFGNG